ncbi:hypothetical protein OG21DRAFT_1367305, partial [Imleria badia]
EVLRTLSHPGIPPHRLNLKVRCLCLLMRNLLATEGLVYNARVEVTGLHQYFLEIRVLGNSEIHLIPRIPFHFTPPSSSCSVQRKQYPLRLAYACAFNGCLGLTFSRAVVDLRTQPFTHGQLYTALSRV